MISDHFELSVGLMLYNRDFRLVTAKRRSQIIHSNELRERSVESEGESSGRERAGGREREGCDPICCDDVPVSLSKNYKTHIHSNTESF